MDTAPANNPSHPFSPSALPVDVKRSVKATLLSEYADDVTAPGACYAPSGPGWEGVPMLLFSCPGCQQFGGIRVGNPKPEKAPSWKIEKGTREDPTTLTLTPSINCVGCCGWHGFLTDGVFQSC